MPIALTKWCVYHEVYSGPFVKNVDVRYPSWSPSEKNKNEKMKFLRIMSGGLMQRCRGCLPWIMGRVLLATSTRRWERSGNGRAIGR